MSLFKRAAAILCVVAIACSVCFCLAGCGKEIAAKWNNGEITEESVTNTIENLRTYYGLTDDAAWEQFIKERTYEKQDDSTLTATEKAISHVKKEEDNRPADGTVQEFREYIIEQMIRSQIIQDEIEKRKIDVSDEELDQYVEQQRQLIESRIMPGVFESVLQRQGYSNLEEYKKEIKEQLKQYKLQTEVSSGNEEGATVSGKDAWNEWFDGMYSNAGVVINPAPEPLPYDVVEGSSQETE